MRLSCFLRALLLPFGWLEERQTHQLLPHHGLQDSSPGYPGLLDATYDELMTGLVTGNFTSVDLVRAYATRIHETNDMLHSVTELNPDALAIASVLDTARANGLIIGPLHGLPVLLKDNIATRDRMNNTAGSTALLGAMVPDDSTVAARLRRAGAILLGKANMSQWASSRSMNSSEGWSAHGGQTKGAYYPDQDPSGSSSGSGVAASLGLAWAAIGTETAGSILQPSGWHNVVGIKPSVGLTSRHLVIPISEHQDTVGPMARTVRDAARILGVIAGFDLMDNYTAAIPWADTPDYVGACRLSGLEGRRLGVPRHLLRHLVASVGEDATAPVISAFDSSLDTIRAAGATVVDDIALPGLEALMRGRHMQAVLHADLVADLERYLSLLLLNPQRVRNLSDIRDFTRSRPREDYPHRDTGIFDAALDLPYAAGSPEFWDHYNAAQHLAGDLGLAGALRNHSLDAIVLPTEASAILSAVAGSPAISVPMGRFPEGTKVTRKEWGNLVATAPNVPFGITFSAERFSEEKLVGMAYAFEQRTMVRRKVKPVVLPRTEIGAVVAERLDSRWEDL